ncbi:hypothetical protein ABG768_001156, partial [Culter alburnus]
MLQTVLLFYTIDCIRFSVFSLISTTAAESGAAVSPVLGCKLDNDTYICTGAQYRMYCNTRMHRFYYQRYQNQNQYQCLSNDCICVGNKDTCACYYNTSSCFCEIFSNNNTIPTAVRPVLDCELNNDTYICTGARYHMYCNTTVNYFSYSKYLYQNQYQYQCWNNKCDCRFNKDSCTCYSSVSSSCFCTNYGYSISLSSTRSPVTDPDCRLYNDTYICAGAQYRMYCNTRMHYFSYWRYQNQNQHEYQCWNNNCNCRGNKDTCTCYSSTLSSCFCENYNNNITIPTAVSPVTDPDCVLYNDTYICTGAQYRMYCNTRMHYFSSQRYQYQNHYQCVNNNCDCYGNKDTCTCYSHTLSSCFCETYGNIIALTTSVTPVFDCVLYNDTYICTGAQYRMYCNTGLHYFSYRRYQNQNQYEYQCWNNNCNCIGNKDTCTCYSRTLSSCFCENYNNNITIPTAVRPIYNCVLYNDTYICTGAQYRMYCNTTMHHFSYWRYQNQNQYEYRCWNNCDCRGNKDTCTCYSRTLSSCFCETYGYSIALITAVPPAYECGLNNDTYICTGAQYRMYCNTTMHNFFYRRYQNQNQYEYQCWNNCNCIGNKDSCTCYSRTLSSCFCENYSNNITIPTAVTPAYGCVLYNDTYICTGAQYRMYCNTRMHDFSYWRYQNQNQHQYQCSNNNCDCVGNKDTCTCYTSILSSCFCETYGNIIALITAVTPAYECLDNILPDQCRSQTSGGCLQNLLDNIESITDQVLPLTVVTTVLDVALNTSKISGSADSKEQVTLGNSVIKASEKLISSLVKPTDTSDNVSFILDSIEVQVFMIGPKFTSDQIPQLDTKNVSMDIDLVGIAKSNNGTAAVAIMCYSTMETLLKPELFNSSNDTVKTMMSTVISATLPKTTNTELTKPVNFSLKHIREFDPSGSLSCVYWNISEWIVDGCSVLETNSSYTVCSCVHLSTFALIMQTSTPPDLKEHNDSLLDLLNLVCVIVGLVFFSLALLTFALCQWSPGVNNVARINICISLLLAHILFLLTQQFLSLIRPHQVSCAVISGVLHFLFLSGFVWMFIEAVLLFICVKNLSQISSKKREVLSTGYLCVIGYMVALVVVGVSVGLLPEGYGSEQCWIKIDKGFIWTFLGPVCMILT